MSTPPPADPHRRPDLAPAPAHGSAGKVSLLAYLCAA